MADKALRALADALGLAFEWIDADGRPRVVAPDSLRAIAAALGYDASSAAAIAESRARIAEASDADTLPHLLVATRGRALSLPSRFGGARFRIELENGAVQEGTADRESPTLPALATTGYHRLEIGGAETTVAVAPARCFSVEDIGNHPTATRRWGLATQIYALRRDGDNGIGDFRALGDLAVAAAEVGADALAMSPVHATFAAAPERSSPYSPSSRLFLNALLASADVRFESDAPSIAPDDPAPLIDWSAAGARKYERLAGIYRGSLATNAEALRAFDDFRAQGGDSLAR